MIHATIDELLGPSESRYFGAGFRHVVHRVTDVMVDPRPGVGTVSAAAAVDYPADWSVKTTDCPLRPHVSTVDALIIAVQVAEAYLTQAHGLDRAARARMWLAGFEMKAGASAQERLSDVEVRGRRRPFGVAATGRDIVSRLDIRVGTLDVACDITHDVGCPVTRPARWADIDEALGGADRRLYGRGFLRRRQEIDDIAIDAELGTVSASVRVAEFPGPAGLARDGLSGSFEPSLSMVDGLIASAQLAQALAYQVEGVAREQTGTLWMRRFGMRADAPRHPVAGPFAVSGQVVRRRRLDRMGRSWRTYDLAGDIDGIRTVASVAFNVPRAVRAAVTDTNGGRR
jgi:hypothetical protein